jgi:hypothetical protein
VAVLALAQGALGATGRVVTEVSEVGRAWAGHPVGFALETAGDRQYVAYFDDRRRLVVAARQLGVAGWERHELPEKLDWDSHKGLTLAVDAAGFIHVSGNMHGSPLVYYRSLEPHDISEFERADMVGSKERHVTYPEFLRDREGRLVFQYRDGRSGRGEQILNIYDDESRRWRRLLDVPLLDGRDVASAYKVGPMAGPNGDFHLVWMWRDSPSGADNHDLSYARSSDLVHWETADGVPIALPLTPETAGVVIDPVAAGGGLAGVAFGLGWDGDQRPIITYSRYDAAGASQAYNARFEAGRWRVRQASDWSFRWDLDRTGTLPAEIAVEPVELDPNGRLVQWYRHVEAGSGGWLLDPATLAPIGEVERPSWWTKLRGVEGRFPGLEVREFAYDGVKEYFLRWETLAVNRDQRRRGRLPPPSILVVCRLGSGPAVDLAARREPDIEVPDDETLEAEGARIGKILIYVSDVFEQHEIDRWAFLYNFVNRIHVRTRDWVIRDSLLFESGDVYSPRLLRESERILRGRRFLYNASIRPIAYRDGVVDLEVATRDVWTLNGGASLSRSGGENATRFEIQDMNFLGTGSDVGIEYLDGVDRSETALHYRHNNFRGSRAEIEVVASDNSDGERYLMKVFRPFYALDTKSSTGLVLLTDDRIDPFFELGERVSEFRHEFDFAEAWWGRSRGLVDGKLWRWTLGFTYNSNVFSEAAGRVAPAVLPEDRIQSFPWIELEYLEDRYLAVRNLDQLDRTEDLLLGKRFKVRLGRSSEVFGASRDRLLMGADAGLGIQPGKGKLLLSNISVGARWDDDDIETFNGGAGIRFFWRNWRKHLLSVELFGNYVRNLDDELQLLLGGDSGLRGYPLRYQSGNRRLLLTVEQRFFTKWEIFKIAHVGGAVFFDAGRAWFAGGEGPDDDLGILKDVGFGLRFSSSRSGRGNVLHLDVAFPLDRGDGIDGVQWLVSTKQTL